MARDRELLSNAQIHLSVYALAYLAIFIRTNLVRQYQIIWASLGRREYASSASSTSAYDPPGY